MIHHLPVWVIPLTVMRSPLLRAAACYFADIDKESRIPLTETYSAFIAHLCGVLVR